jgi:hypothetical protein
MEKEEGIISREYRISSIKTQPGKKELNNDLFVYSQDQ